MENRMIRAVGYRRVSMREQVDGHSLDAQENNIREYARQQGWEVERIYTDAGISAKKDSHRPALEQMMQDAAAGKFDVIIVDKIDRFYRHLAGLLTALDRLNEVGVGFVSVQERLDFTTHWGKLTLTVLGILAEIYIEALRQETKKGKRQRAREGIWNGNIPYGYCNGKCSVCTDANGEGYCPNFGKPDLSQDKTLIAHPIDQYGVRLAFEWYASGEYSDAKVTEGLNAYPLVLPDGTSVRLRQKGTPGKSSPGLFNRDMVRGVLTNIFYTGKVPYYGTDKNGRPLKRCVDIANLHPGRHPMLVDDATFAKVQELRQLLATNPKFRHETRARIYPLSGILCCGLCGGRMRGIAGSEGRRYYRDATQIDRVGQCRQPLIRASHIERQVVGRLVQIAQEGASAVRSAQERFEAAEARFQRARQLFLGGDMSREEYAQEKERRDNLQKGLQPTIDGAILLPIETIQNLSSEWHEMAPAEQKKLLRMALEAAFIRKNALVALQPTIAFLPLMGKPHCRSGPDGHRITFK